jgi:hypothetical protein
MASSSISRSPSHQSKVQTARSSAPPKSRATSRNKNKHAARSMKPQHVSNSHSMLRGWVTGAGMRKPIWSHSQKQPRTFSEFLLVLT